MTDSPVVFELYYYPQVFSLQQQKTETDAYVWDPCVWDGCVQDLCKEEGIRVFEIWETVVRYPGLDCGKSGYCSDQASDPNRILKLISQGL